MIIEEDQRSNRKEVIDLSGPEGNAYFLMGRAGRLCQILNLDKDAVIGEMKSGDYENLLQVFDKHFGHLIDLQR